MVQLITDKPKPIICLMGPTASGKTPLAIELVQRYPLEIISVDSAMVYREMNIGTAKPDAETLKRAPHHLIDIVDPKESYSAGQFRADALSEIEVILSRGKIPLLVGGTMLYFRVLQQGLATLPTADQAIRAQLKAQAEAEGWEALHAWLHRVDPESAERIHLRDTQRIQRALEVYLLTGKPISVWQQQGTQPMAGYNMLQLVLMPPDRALLHQRIEQRFDAMLAQGFVAEVEALFHRGDLSPEMPSMRSVGYRQGWAYLLGELSASEMRMQAITATRQLAKRQMTWLRYWQDKVILESPDLTQALEKIAHFIEKPHF